jgi:hypothetical protein
MFDCIMPGAIVAISDVATHSGFCALQARVRPGISYVLKSGYLPFAYNQSFCRKFCLFSVNLKKTAKISWKLAKLSKSLNWKETNKPALSLTSAKILQEVLPRFIDHGKIATKRQQQD